ncbi:hypothetical protein FEM48_Zijuj04G0121700 [Ziziphus jujuba var. spinosa]|uniref:Diacylglycerol O-acyltransferase n=1 Tax=Ziziphus jujuba var. spinosa TaxID=714518 RepID=A0A978VJT2_ZIZJJ|nr:hypothetical protein FEM48_Zijuj04G0121700 [Ziziphus jujuba var. spinosa]
MEFGETMEPVSPTGQYLNSSVLSLSIIAVLEIGVTINDSQTMSLLENLFLPINPRFSSIMVDDKNGEKRWKKVEVKLEDHVKVPLFPSGLSLESYDKYFGDYLSKIAAERFSLNKPLWEIHIVKYPTTNAAGNLIFKLHHALGDGYSLMGALLSCLQRADNPSLPLTFPSIKNSKLESGSKSIFGYVTQIFSSAFNSMLDFNWSILKSSFLEDDQTPIRSSWNDPMAEFQSTTITTLTFSIDQIKLIKAKLNVTINDVIVGMVFFGTRLYMQEISEESTKSSSTALVLLNTRMLDDYKSVKEMMQPDTRTTSSWGNQFAFLHISIPKLTEFSNNPLDFIYFAQKLIKRKKFFSSLPHCMTISNIIGPVEQMELANHPISGLYYMVAGTPEDLDIAVVSYMGKVKIAFGTKTQHIDSEKFKSCMQKAFETMFEATQKFYKGRIN